MVKHRSKTPAVIIRAPEMAPAHQHDHDHRRRHRRPKSIRADAFARGLVGGAGLDAAGAALALLTTQATCTARITFLGVGPDAGPYTMPPSPTPTKSSLFATTGKGPPMFHPAFAFSPFDCKAET